MNKVIYHAHPSTGEFIGLGCADPDPLDAGGWLIPAHAFEDLPPVPGENQVAVRIEGGWQLQPDYRGTVYFTAAGKRHEITEIGVSIPEDGLLEAPPPLPLTRVQIEAQRLTAYADPLAGSDRYFAEAARMQAMSETGWEDVRAAGVARYQAIQAEYPWP